MKKKIQEVIKAGTFDDKATHTYRHFLEKSKAYFIGGPADAIEKEIKLLNSGDEGALNRAYRYYESKINLKLDIFKKIGASDLYDTFLEEYGQAGAGLRKIGAMKVSKKRDINLPDKVMVAEAYTTLGEHFGKQAKNIDKNEGIIILKDSGLTAKESEIVVNAWNNDEDPTEAYYSIAGRSDDTERSERRSRPTYTEAERKEGERIVEQIKKEIATETHWVIQEHSQGDYVSTSFDKGLPFFNFNEIRYADKFKTRNEAEDVIAILNTVYPKTSFSVKSAEIPVESEEVKVDMIYHPDKLYEITWKGKKMVVTLEYLKELVIGDYRVSKYQVQKEFEHSGEKDIESFVRNSGFVLRGDAYVPLILEKLENARIGKEYEGEDLSALEKIVGKIKVIPYSPDIKYIDSIDEVPQSFNERYEALKQRHPEVYSRQSTTEEAPEIPALPSTQVATDTYFVIRSAMGYVGKTIVNGLPMLHSGILLEYADRWKNRSDAEEIISILHTLYPKVNYFIEQKDLPVMAKGGAMSKYQQAKEKWEAIESRMKPHQKKIFKEIYDKGMKEKPDGSKPFDSITDESIAEYINSGIQDWEDWEWKDLKATDITIPFFNLGFKFVAYNDAIKEPEFYPEMAKGGAIKKPTFDAMKEAIIKKYKNQDVIEAGFSVLEGIKAELDFGHKVLTDYGFKNNWRFIEVPNTRTPKSKAPALLIMADSPDSKDTGMYAFDDVAPFDINKIQTIIEWTKTNVRKGGDLDIFSTNDVYDVKDDALEVFNKVPGIYFRKHWMDDYAEGGNIKKKDEKFLRGGTIVDAEGEGHRRLHFIEKAIEKKIKENNNKMIHAKVITKDGAKNQVKRYGISTNGILLEMMHKQKRRGRYFTETFPYQYDYSNLIGVQFFEEAEPKTYAHELVLKQHYLQKHRHPNLWDDLAKDYSFTQEQLEEFAKATHGLSHYEAWQKAGEMGLPRIEGHKTITMKSAGMPEWARNNLKDAIDNKRDYSHRWNCGWDCSVSVAMGTDGIYRGWFSQEFKGTGNGHYWLLISPEHAIFAEND